MIRRLFTGKGAAILLILGFGAGKMPMEQAVTHEAGELGLRMGKLDLSLREQFGQMTLAAAFGGFRSLAASLVSVSAFEDFRRYRWNDLEDKYRLVTQLEPRLPYHWYTAFSHLAYDANSFFVYDQVVESQESPGMPITDKERKYYSELYLDRGISFLEEGIRNNPDSSDLYMAAGRIYQDPNRPRLDPEKASEAYRKASECPHAPSFARRFYAYALSEVAGREEEAYDLLKELYHRGTEQRKPTLMMRILVMEELLKIPEEDRLPIDKAHTYKLLAGYRPIRLSENPAAIRAAFRSLEDALNIPEEKRQKL